ncbi:MAG: LAGLIDADG family homing endonuclease, partial [Bacteroidota bacterium]
VAKLSSDGTRLEPLSRKGSEQVWGLWPRNKEQRYALELLLDDRIKLVSLVGNAGVGKAQPLDAKIMTPDGWKLMGDMHPGSLVMTPDGISAKVLDVFPQGKKDIYKVTFTDGSSTECCKDHLWHTKTCLDRDAKKAGSVKSLQEIMESLRYGNRQSRNHSIPITQPLNFAEKELPLDPYLLGCLIGDGAMSVGHLSLSTSDPFILDECLPMLKAVNCYFGASRDYDHSICCNHPAGIPPRTFIRTDLDSGEQKQYLSLRDLEKDGFTTAVYRAVDRNPPHYRGYHWQAIRSKKHSVHPIKNTLIELGLWGCRSETKFIPEQFLFASISQRISLLQGLMDTDGTIAKRGHCSFTSVSQKLASDVATLVQTLGGTAIVRSRQTSYTYKGEKRLGQLSYRVSLCLPNDLIPFRLPRKVERLRPHTKYFPRRYVDT